MYVFWHQLHRRTVLVVVPCKTLILPELTIDVSSLVGCIEVFGIGLRT
jgi:hypothetical protein